MKEVVLFDRDGKEIDWYDPVEEEPKIENGNLIIDNGIYIYKISIKKFSKYKWREQMGGGR